MRSLAGAAALLGAALSLPAAAAPHVEAALLAETATLAPGENTVGLRLAPEDGWHVYWINPGDSGLPTELRWTLPPGFAAGPLQWPAPERHRFGEIVNYGYGTATLHPVTLHVPADAVGTTAVLEAQARWLACRDICIPGQARLSLSRAVTARTEPDPALAPVFADARARLPRRPPLVGRFETADGILRIALPLAEDTDGEFFAATRDLVQHNAPAAMQRTQGELRLAQPLALGAALPERVAGVWVADGRARRAYAVELRPGAVAPVENRSAPAPAGPALPLVLVLALLGGLILNLMPCVFPVLSIKAVALLEARGAAAAHRRSHALAYTAGVVGSCLAAGLAILGLRAGGQALGWGFQLQSPLFVAVLAYLIFALGLSMSGLLQFGTALMGVGQTLTQRGGHSGSFFTGVLAVAVASPCTAPFMGTALGYALTQPPALALLVFACLGLGLALPFLAIGFAPRAGAWLPRPGAWMETFKQAMAYPLYLTAVWLLWVLGRQAGNDAVAAVLAGLVLLAFAAWIRAAAAPRVALALRGLALAGAFGLLLALDDAGPAAPAAAAESAWEPYSDRRLAELRAQGRPVFVNLTADWCLTCKFNERVALDTAVARQAFAARGVALLKGDWTRSDPSVTRVLERFERPGVPLYLLYGTEGEPQTLPQVLTASLVADAVRALP